MKQYTDYKGYTIVYYKEFGAWTGIVEEFRGTNNYISRSGITEFLAVQRVKQSIDALLKNQNPLAELRYKGYLLKYNFEEPIGASYIIHDLEDMPLATADGAVTSLALSKAKSFVDAIEREVHNKSASVNAIQRWLS